MEGKVKWYNVKKGYGFIAGDDGNEYFVHFTGLVKGTKLYTDDVVSFDPVETDKGLQAQKVAKPEGSGSDSDSGKAKDTDSEASAAKTSSESDSEDEKSSSDDDQEDSSGAEDEQESSEDVPVFEDAGAEPGTPEETGPAEEEVITEDDDASVSEEEVSDETEKKEED